MQEESKICLKNSSHLEFLIALDTNSLLCASVVIIPSRSRLQHEADRSSLNDPWNRNHSLYDHIRNGCNFCPFGVPKQSESESECRSNRDRSHLFFGSLRSSSSPRYIVVRFSRLTLTFRLRKLVSLTIGSKGLFTTSGRL